MKGNPIVLWKVLLTWSVFVSYFCSFFVMIVGMPHHEPGHHHGHLLQQRDQDTGDFSENPNQNYGDTQIGQYNHVDPSSSSEIFMMKTNSMDTPLPDITNISSTTLTAIDTNPAITETDIMTPPPSMEVAPPLSSPSLSSQTTTKTDSEIEPEPYNYSNTDDIGVEVVNITKPPSTAETIPTVIEFIQNEITRPSLSFSEKTVKQQQEVENVVEDAGGEFPPTNSITPTMPSQLSLPPPPPPPSPSSPPPLLPPPPTVIDPISFQRQNQQQTLQNNDDDSTGVSSTSTSFFAETLPIIVPGASSPSIQLIPPSSASQQTTPQSPPDIPREPDLGELPESPEPQSPLHPYNLQDIPITLISLSGNSGGSSRANDMETFSILVSPTENVPLDFTKYRYHVVTGQLFKIGSTGPGICPENMRFFAVPGHPKNGACDCDYYQCSRPLIYSPQMHKCYWAWSQGPCDKTEWFVFDKDLRRRGICEKNPCPITSLSSSSSNNDTNIPYPTQQTSSLEYYFQSPEDQQCYQAGTRGNCGDQDERLLMYPGEPIPKCRTFTSCYPLTVPQELQCVFGNKYFVESGQCQ